jgi:hypothetical protein
MKARHTFRTGLKDQEGWVVSRADKMYCQVFIKPEDSRYLRQSMWLYRGSCGSDSPCPPGCKSCSLAMWQSRPGTSRSSMQSLTCRSCRPAGSGRQSVYQARGQ